MVNVSDTSSARASASPPPRTTHAEPGTSGGSPQCPAVPSGALQGLTLRARPAGPSGAAIAPRASLPLAPQGAAQRPQPAVTGEVSVSSAQREMDRLLRPLDDIEGLLTHGSPASLESFIPPHAEGSACAAAARAARRGLHGLPRQVRRRTRPQPRVAERPRPRRSRQRHDPSRQARPGAVQVLDAIVSRPARGVKGSGLAPSRHALASSRHGQHFVMSRGCASPSMAACGFNGPLPARCSRQGAA